jgi:hypothetical protein
MNEDLLTTWRSHARVQRYVLDAVAADALTAQPGSGSSTSTLGSRVACVVDTEPAR